MNRDEFDARLDALLREHDELIANPNERISGGNGVFARWKSVRITTVCRCSGEF